jgi:general secretion pathway protein G
MNGFLMSCPPVNKAGGKHVPGRMDIGDERMKETRKSSGFTLIELLLVMVILSVLATVVVPKFTRRSEQARTVAAQSSITNIEVALEAFEVDNGRYPSTEEGLQALLEAPSGLNSWKGPYIKKGISKDPWGNPYVYRSPGQHNSNSFDLFSFGPDRQEGGNDDIDNWSEE